jgi:hypothetical protein
VDLSREILDVLKDGGHLPAPLDGGRLGSGR